ncbi:MAG: class I SAM-dependent methyltransferase [Candidatus Riflemargulisbacteria bacterium]
MHTFNPKDFQKLITPERYNIINPVLALKDIGLKEGDCFLDFGCGPGFFTVPASQIVTKRGKVFALDIFEEMLQEVANANLSAPAELVKLYDSNIPLSDEIANLVFLAFVLHEVTEKKEIVSELYRTTKVNGKIAIIEWNETNTEKGPEVSERVSSMETMNLLMQAGYKDIVHKDINSYHYLIQGTKR